MSDLERVGIPTTEIQKWMKKCVFPIYFKDSFIGNGFYISENIVVTAFHTIQVLLTICKDEFFSLVFLRRGELNTKFTRLLYPNMGPDYRATGMSLDVVFLETEAQTDVWLPLELEAIELETSKVLIPCYVVFSSDNDKKNVEGNIQQKPVFYGFDSMISKVDLQIGSIRLGGINAEGQSGGPIYCLKRHSVVGVVKGIARDRVSLHFIKDSKDSEFAEVNQTLIQLHEKGLGEGTFLPSLRIFWPGVTQFHNARQVWEETILAEDNRTQWISDKLKKSREWFQPDNTNELGVRGESFTYIRKSAEEKTLLEFSRNLNPDEGFAFLLSGKTGVGKSTTFLHFLRSLNEDEYVILFKNCRGNYGTGLSESFQKSLGFDPFDKQIIPFLKLWLRGRTLLFAVDELNHLGRYPGPPMDELVENIRSLWSTLGVQKVKVIFVIRTEFVPLLFPQQFHMWEQANIPPCLESKSFWVLGKESKSGTTMEQTKYWMEMGELDGDSKKVFYEAYLQVEGYQPQATFDQLTPAIRGFLTRPAYFPTFMKLYNGKTIPRAPVSSGFQGRFGLLLLLGEVLDKGSRVFLRQLAMKIFDLASEKIAFDHLPPIKPNFLEDLIKNSQIITSQNKRGTDWFEFTYEWAFEWFLAEHFSIQLEYMDAQERIRFIASMPEQFSRKKHQQRLAEVYFNLAMLIRIDVPEDETLIFDILNLKENDEGIQQFSYFLFDALLTEQSSPKSGLEEDHPKSNFLDSLFRPDRPLTQAGAKRLISYTESLEWLGEYHFGVRLLTLPHLRWPDSMEVSIRQRSQLSLAFHLLYQGDKTEAQEVISQVEKNLSDPQLEEKRRYILGRTLQYANRFEESKKVYSLSGPPVTEYGIRCQHQLAFRAVLDHSEFFQAAQLLETILNTPYNFKPSLYESELLLRTCQIRMGRYEDAYTPLYKLIQNRHKAIHTHKEATARRALADLYLCSFQGNKALQEIQNVIAILARINNRPSLIYAMDIQAQILAFLFGEEQKALIVIEQSIAMAREERKKSKHIASLSWNLQTKRLIMAIASIEKRQPTSEEDLSIQSNYSPYQAFRQSFVDLLEKLFSPNVSQWKEDGTLAQETKRLLKRAMERNWGWYPIVFETILNGLQKNSYLISVQDQPEGSNWTKTALFARICEALDSP